MKHQPFHHIHPALVLSLRTRTRLFGTVNLAVAVRGSSCGWGTCRRPRRTFVGYVPRPKNDTGRHFIEIATSRESMRCERVWLRVGDHRAVAHQSSDRVSGDV